MPEAQNKKLQHINEAKDGDTSYILHPDDNDLFFRTGKQIIESCQLGISIEVWIDELNSMVEHVRAWASGKNDRVRTCYCTPKGTKVVLFFSPNSAAFDFDLADCLSVLNLELIQKFNVGMVEVHQIPWNEIDRFVDTESTKLIYGEHFKPPAAVEA